MNTTTSHRLSTTTLAAMFACATAIAWPTAALAQIFGDTTERVSVASDGTQGN